MNKLILTFTIVLLSAAAAFAQGPAKARGSAQAASQTNAQGSAESITLASGTQLTAELMTSLDAKQAKPGDEFRLRTLKPVMAGGKRIVDKGAILVGRVTESTKAEGKQGVSQLKLAFDQLRNKNLSLPFSATIEQITQASASGQSQIDEMGSSSETQGSARSQTSAASGGSAGGLLGGVTTTVGGVVGGTVNATNSTVGSVAGTTHQTLGQVIATSSATLNSATESSGRATRLISISSDSSAEAGTNSTLSLTGRNVRIEKGATFWLRTDKSVDFKAK
jgi:hypothetical protein